MDNCTGIDTIFQKGKIGEVYNIGGENEIMNIDLTKKLLKCTDKDLKFIEYVKDRPGHDRRYSIDSKKLKKLGWSPEHDFDFALKSTVEWYRKNESWWKPLKEECT
jgi:dTDP-glucose 4,6-dehydratase